MTATPHLFAHLLAMSDATGLFEHALLTEPRLDHGYCVDDVARGLVVLARMSPSPTWPDGDSELTDLGRRYLRFVMSCQDDDGRVVNRRDVFDTPHGSFGVEDCWGRALWGLGTVASRSRDGAMAATALERFELSATRRSPWPRAMAFAGLGAAEVLRQDGSHVQARSLLADAAVAVGRPAATPGWPWPEDRLTYANAVVPDVLLAAGDCLDDASLVSDGLTLLGWLLDVETNGDHLSVTPTGGWALGETRPAFDQQAIEVATLTDACARAYELTGDDRWSAAVARSAAWFFGSNDVDVCLYDELSGGCCDGLEAHGRNENQGAESTLALISTVQHSSRIAGAHATYGRPLWPPSVRAQMTR